METAVRRVVLVPVSGLRPIEGHGPKRKLWLAEKIAKEGVWRVPLRVESSMLLVMDGHHRLEVARLLELQRVPVLTYSYDEVGLYSLRKTIAVSKEVIYENAANGVIFPYKTAKHIFPDEATHFEGVPIDELR